MASTEIKTNLRQRVSAALQNLPGGALLFAIVPVVVLGYLGWFYYGASHLDRALYSVRAEHLQVTPQPPWIKSNVAEQVFRDQRLDRISLLDPQANATIAQAFEKHPWVKRTTRVTKSSGAKVAVDVVYRKPLAMVYCAPTDADQGFLPVDAEGIRLPEEDFSAQQVYDYFLIIGQGAPPPTGSSGMDYGSSLVSDALKLCRFLEQHREPLDLQRVYVDEQPPGGRFGRPSITLQTGDKHVVLWGHVPNAEMAGELQAPEKLAKMISWLSQQRAVQSAPGKLDLLTGPATEPVAPNPVSRGLPQQADR